MTYDDLDAQLINELLADGRASLRSIAETLGVSVTTVSTHLADLEDDGIIEGFEPRLNYTALGYDVTAVLELKVEGSALPELAHRLKERPQMVSVYEVTGDHDVIAIGKFETTDDMNNLIKTLLADADVKESNTSVVLDAPTEHEQFPIELDESEPSV